MTIDVLIQHQVCPFRQCVAQWSILLGISLPILGLTFISVSHQAFLKLLEVKLPTSGVNPQTIITEFHRPHIFSLTLCYLTLILNIYHITRCWCLLQVDLNVVSLAEFRLINYFETCILSRLSHVLLSSHSQRIFSVVCSSDGELFPEGQVHAVPMRSIRCLGYHFAIYQEPKLVPLLEVRDKHLGLSPLNYCVIFIFCLGIINVFKC